MLVPTWHRAPGSRLRQRRALAMTPLRVARNFAQCLKLGAASSRCRPRGPGTEASLCHISPNAPRQRRVASVDEEDTSVAPFRSSRTEAY